MQFNTVDFALFFPLVFALYWFVCNRTIKIQNIFLILVSYFFYAFWDWRFLSLIFLSSLVDYSVGSGMVNASEYKRKVLLAISLLANLGVLLVFKYFNFFADTFIQAFTFFGKPIRFTALEIVLPVGISFYTFQTLSYTIDLYRGKIQPAKDIFSFFAFVCFFPQLVAGPIERASHLLPQFEKKRWFTYTKSVEGLQLILGGLFKKMVIADNAAIIVDMLFDNYQDYSGSTLLCGAMFFGFQIYGDFSGYSDTAIGTGRLLGFDLMKNFNNPYLSKNSIEFWRRWHISLSTWFRDYVYIPLGGNQVSQKRWVFNILLVFLLSGLWHGANITFVVWGVIHGVLLISTVWVNRYWVKDFFDQKTSLLLDFIRISATFLMITLAWVFFRAETISEAFGYISGIFQSSLFSIPTGNKGFLLFLFIYLFVEWLQRDSAHVFDLSAISSKTARYFIYYTTVGVLFYYAGDLQTFIYFQF